MSPRPDGDILAHIRTEATKALLGQFDDETVAKRDAAIHLRRNVEIMRRDNGGKTRGSYQLRVGSAQVLSAHS